MSAPASKKRFWKGKFAKLLAAAKKADEAVLVAVHQARQDGLSQADVGGMIGMHPTVIASRDAKGEAILKARKDGKSS